MGEALRKIVLARTKCWVAALMVEAYMKRLYFPSAFRTDWDGSCGCLVADSEPHPDFEDELKKVAAAFLAGWEANS